MSLDQLLSYQHIVVIVAIMGFIEVLKGTLALVKVIDKKPTQIILPYLPLVLGSATAFVPSVIQADGLWLRLFIGIALGGMSGQVWKIVKTNVDLLKGKL